MNTAPSRSDCLWAGLFYLGLGVAGSAAFMGVRPQVFAAPDAAETLANLTSREGLARIGIALELATVVFQALCAMWFTRVFRHVDIAAAMAVALFGVVNAVAILISSTLLRAALDAAGAEPSIAHGLVAMSGRFWDAGAVFFGLWLLPMGCLVLKSRFGPRALGLILILGSAAYVANVFIAVLIPNAGVWVAALPLLATVGEFWMIGLLLWKGLRPAARAATT